MMLGIEDMPVAATCYSSWGCMVARAARKLGPGVLPFIPNPAENDVRNMQCNSSGWSATGIGDVGFIKLVTWSILYLTLPEIPMNFNCNFKGWKLKVNSWYPSLSEYKITHLILCQGISCEVVHADVRRLDHEAPLRMGELSFGPATRNSGSQTETSGWRSAQSQNMWAIREQGW